MLFVDWLSPATTPDARELSQNAEYVSRLLGQFGFGRSFSLLDASKGRSIAGLPRSEVVARARRSLFLLNVMGYLRDDDILAAVPRRVFLDIDPGFGQMWRELGLADPFAGHDVHVTVGLNVGTPSCGVPSCGLDWLATVPPVVLDEWPPAYEGGNAFTSVATWRGAYGPVEYRGETYGLRVHEFRKFAELPTLTEARFELALDIHPDDANDRELLVANRWALAEPAAVAGDPWRYRAYVQRSRAEIGIAKSMYVKTRSAWFSDRSACYLASAKPVLAQETGFSEHYPTGTRLLAFSTLEEARAGAEAIAADYGRHVRAAREIAEEYFDSDKVLSRLVDLVAAR